jgi:hypothetical protein
LLGTAYKKIELQAMSLVTRAQFWEMPGKGTGVAGRACRNLDFNQGGNNDIVVQFCS